MSRSEIRAELDALNADLCAALRARFASGEATEEDLAIAVELLAVNDVRRGGVNDPFEEEASAS